MTAPKDCQLCPALAACRKQVVQGFGSEAPLILFVGQNPGRDEDVQGKPFVGKSGTLLALLARKAHIQMSQIRRTNAVRCASPGNRKPSNAEIDACRGFLEEEIKATNPAVIVTLGDTALTSLYQRAGPEWDSWNHQKAMYMAALLLYEDDLAAWEAKREELGVKSIKGYNKPKKPVLPKQPKSLKMPLKDIVGQTLVHAETGIPIIPTYHPAFLMRGKWAYTALVVEHLKKALRLALGEQETGELGEYHTIKTLKQLKKLRDYLLSSSVSTIFFDTETTGLKWKDSELLCISFSGAVGEGYVLPILYKNPEGNLDIFPAWTAPGALKKVIQILTQIFGSTKPKCGHNLLFDARMLERSSASSYIKAVTAFGIKIADPLKDTELMHHAVAEALPHSMTSLLAQFTDMPYYEHELHAQTAGKKRMWKADNEVLWKYSAADADGLPRLEEALMPIIEDEGTLWVLENVTYPMIRVCREMEDNGLLIDQDYFDRLCRWYDWRIEQVEEQLWAAVPELGRGWRYWVPADLQDVLFKHLKLPMPEKRRTKGGRGCPDCATGLCFKHAQTGKDALADIQALHPHPILDPLLELKSLTKIKGTYLDGSAKGKKHGWKGHIRADGRIHASFKLSRVETGRLAAEDPNVHNPPKGLHIHPIGWQCEDEECGAYYEVTFGLNTMNAFRDIIIAPPGKVILQLDWAQLEVWVMAYYLYEHFGDRTLLDIILSGRDIHTVVGMGMYPELDSDLNESEWRAVHKNLRDEAKPFVFGTQYGLTDEGAAQRLHKSVEEAAVLKGRFLRFVKGLPLYFQKIWKDIIEGHVENRFGRRRHTVEASILEAMHERTDLEKLWRESINMPIQGGGSDLHSIVSYRTAIAGKVALALRERGVRTILSVHDSLAFEADAPENDYVVQTAWMIKRLWEDTAKELVLADGTKLGWECKAEVEWGSRWGTPEFRLSISGALKDLRR